MGYIVDPQTLQSMREDRLGYIDKLDHCGLINEVLGYSGLLERRWHGDEHVWYMGSIPLEQVRDTELRWFLEERVEHEYE